MSNYIGVKCPVCNKKFQQTDDIVVCPVCGAPHHRACYAKTGQCAFVGDHMSGKEWRPPEGEAPKDNGSGVIACPSCKSSNPADVIFCQVCGRRMSEAPPPPHPPTQGQFAWGFPGMMEGMNPVEMIYGGLNPDEKIEDESARDLAVYVGDNSAFFLPRFKRIAETSQPLSFNFAALIFNFAYFFYRKMYTIGAMLLALFIICAIPGLLRGQELLPQVVNDFYGTDLPINEAKVRHYQSLASLFNTINVAVCMVMSFFANRLYYGKAIADVKSIREKDAEHHDEIAYNKALAQKGGVSRTLTIVIVSVMLAVYFMIVAFFTIQHLYAGGLLG